MPCHDSKIGHGVLFGTAINFHDAEYFFLKIISMQYCEYGPEPAKCYEWMKDNLPDYYARLVGGGMPLQYSIINAVHACVPSLVGSQMAELTLGEGKRQTRGTVPLHH